MEGIIAAAITGLFALIGVVITVSAGNKKIEHKLEISQAVTQTNLDNLTSEVRRHNDFAIKIPTLEADVRTLKNDVKVLQGFHMHSN